MRDFQTETAERVAFIQKALQDSGAKGLVFGNSGGKDSALAGILCKKACENTVGILMPCASTRNFGSDRDDALALAAQYDIETRTLDLTAVREAELSALAGITKPTEAAISNLAPRLRMLSLYAVAATEGRLVVGTSNWSEAYMGYFTKWGDGASDINPIADLTVGEVYDFLAYLQAPLAIREKAPSAGLYEGQTDEQEMGVTYAAIDRYILTGEATETDRAIIETCHRKTEHKRSGTLKYGQKDQ